jgi:NAD(P)-dependent dehydrogenase (short-subunit alcohol dehydrogenase family)
VKLKNKVAIITGASQGLGKALALRFSEEGASVCICSRNVDHLRLVHLEIFSKNGKSLFEQVDVTDEFQIQEFLYQCHKKFGQFHILINNAAQLGPRVPLANYPPQEWKKILSVNLTGPFLMTKYALQYFSDGGSILNVSSSVGIENKADWGAYGISKFGIEGLTQAFAEELRARRIRVNAINPGAIDTDMRHEAFPKEPLPRLKHPDEILDPFIYLVSDEAKNITGQSLNAQQFKEPTQ